MLSFFLSYLLVYKYTVLFFVIAFASFGFPLPATALLVATGAFAVQGYFSAYAIFFYGLSASLVGDILAFFVSARYGREIFMRLGFKKLLLSPKFRTIEGIFSRHSIAAIFFSRFLATSLGPAVNILSGIARIDYKRFIIYDILGEMLYVMIFGGIGYVFGDQWQAILSISEDATTIVVLTVILLLILVIHLAKGRR